MAFFFYMATYSELLKDPRWQKKRLEIFQRDNFMCRDCFSTEKTLCVHHILYESLNPWETSDKFLITLCEECHKMEEDMKGYDFYPVLQRVGLTRMASFRIMNVTAKYFSFVHNPDCYSVADFLMKIEASKDSITLYRKING